MTRLLDYTGSTPENYPEPLARLRRWFDLPGAPVTGDPGYYDQPLSFAPMKTDPQGNETPALPRVVRDTAQFGIDMLASPYTGTVPENFVVDTALNALGQHQTPGQLGLFLGKNAREAPLENLRKFEAQKRPGIMGHLWSMLGWGSNKMSGDNPFFEISDADAAFDPRGALQKATEAQAEKVREVRGYGPMSPLQEASVPTARKQLINEGYQVRLRDILDHPELYQNYPELADMPVNIGKLGDDSNYAGMYSSNNKSITMRGPRLPTSIAGSRNNKSTLIHEIQHAIQDIEGWPRGGNVEHMQNVFDYGKHATEVLQTRDYIENAFPGATFEEKLQRASQAYPDPATRPAILKGPRVNDAIDPNFDTNREVFKRYKQVYDMGRTMPKDSMAHTLYQRLAGEAQARAAEHRMDWSADARSMETPEDTMRRANDAAANPANIITPDREGRVIAVGKQPPIDEGPSGKVEKKSEGGATNSFFDLTNLEQVPDVPQEAMERYQPPRGISPRLQSVLGDKRLQKRLQGIIEKGVGMGGRRWYNAEPLRKAFINELGDVEGSAAFGRYMDYVAATSPRSRVGDNIRNASFYYGLERQGEAMPDIGTKNPKPYGHMAQRLHQQNAQTVAGPGFDIIKNPKPPTFATNLKGNQLPVTVDAHATKLPAMLSRDPRWLATSTRLERKNAAGESEFYNVYPRRMHEEGGMGMDQALERPVFWDSSPAPNEYGGLEQLYQGIADKAGITPAQAQASAWIAGGDVTGLGSDSSKAFMDFFEQRLMETARQRGITPQEALRRMIRGEQPLLAKTNPIGKAQAVEQPPPSQDRLLQIMGNQS